MKTHPKVFFSSFFRRTPKLTPSHPANMEHVEFYNGCIRITIFHYLVIDLGNERRGNRRSEEVPEICRT